MSRRTTRTGCCSAPNRGRLVLLDISEEAVTAGSTPEIATFSGLGKVVDMDFYVAKNPYGYFSSNRLITRYVAKTLLLVLCCGLTAGVLGEATPASAASKKRKKKAQTEQTAAKPKPTEYEKLFKEKHDVADGMIRLHKVKGKLYFEFPLALLGRDMLLGSTVSEISDNGDAVIGSKPTEPLWVRFTKTGDKVQIRKMVRDNVTDTASPNIARSLEANGIGSHSQIVRHRGLESRQLRRGLQRHGPLPERQQGPHAVRSLRREPPLRTGDPHVELPVGPVVPRGDPAFADNIVVRSHLSYTYTLKSREQRDCQ